MEALRKEGKCDMKFQMDSQFREDFQIQEKTITFKTHLELDTFVQKLLEKDVDFSTKHRSEWVLLKSFDRALWLKHSKFPNMEEYTPLMKEKDSVNHLHCPFGDPTITSFLGLK
jgi:hypothetical protein